MRFDDLAVSIDCNKTTGNAVLFFVGKTKVDGNSLAVWILHQLLQTSHGSFANVETDVLLVFVDPDTRIGIVCFEELGNQVHFLMIGSYLAEDPGHGCRRFVCAWIWFWGHSVKLFKGL